MIADRAQLVSEAFQHLDHWFSMRRRAMCEQPLYHQVSLPQMHILMVLLERGPLTVSEVAHLLSVSTPSASAILDRMEENSLVRRERDQTDRRVVHVSISERGRAAVDELTGVHRERVQRLLSVMTDEELRQVVRGMEAVGKALERLAGNS